MLGSPILLSAPRGGFPNFNADKVATELYNKGAGQWGTNEDAFVKIFSALSYDQLQEVARAYDRLFNSSLIKAVESEFSGDIELALTSLLCDPIHLYCKKLKEATKGMGTDEDTINRIIGGSGKRLLVKQIAKQYFEKYDKDLANVLGCKS